MPELERMSLEPRPVYYRELDILGFDKYWNYEKDDTAPLMWATANNYIYRGRLVAKTKGGALYTPPELELIEEPEPNGQPLKPVDIAGMTAKNAALMETLEQDTIQKIYNVYRNYKRKIDLFYVAFSGGKDSIVALDVVQRSIPHNEFIVLFGDTKMEFSDTYRVIDKVENWCYLNEISFYRTSSKLDTNYTWKEIGPPAQKLRWCCGVHKTAPQILFLRNLTNNPRFRGMAMMGVRADESVQRSQYNELNFGTKHQGQYDFYPIFHWNSAEVFLYIYKENLVMNETYKYGNSRAGCLVCPMEAVKNTWFKNQSYSGEASDRNTTTYYNTMIVNNTLAKEMSEERTKDFMRFGVWKSRHNGSKLISPRVTYHENRDKERLQIILDEVRTDWKEWLKTIGETNIDLDGTVTVSLGETVYKIKYYYKDNKHYFDVYDLGNSKQEIYFASWLKIALKKSAYCIGCQVCEANCPNGYLHIVDGTVSIDDKCTKCKKCYNVNGGCWVASSQLLPKEGIKLSGSVDQYKNMGIRYEWVKEYFKKKNDFWNENALGSEMVKSLRLFLRHADISVKDKITSFGALIESIGIESQITWALMISNLVYTPQFNWWVKHISFNHQYNADELNSMLEDYVASKYSRKNIISGFKIIFHTNPILSEGIGIGIAVVDEKGNSTRLKSIYRSTWSNPDPRVILYSLYKFAEACGNIYQFSLATLLDDEIEREGISPTRIFGLDKETMMPLLNGLSANYPEYISVSFTLGMDSITLRSEKTSEDVLNLF